MKEKVMSAMQAFSKAMFMPVLILPIAGLLIAVGTVLTNARLMEILPFLDNPVTKGFGTILVPVLQSDLQRRKKRKLDLQHFLHSWYLSMP